AATIARSAPGVVDCDRACVAMVVDGVAVAIAVHGYGPAAEAAMRDAQFPRSDIPIDDVLYFSPPYHPSTKTLEHIAGSVAVDIDDFKDVNDGLGHGAGDELLQFAAERIRAAVRAQDRVARLGGDEFAVLVTDADEAVACGVAERIIVALREPFEVLGSRVMI